MAAPEAGPAAPALPPMVLPETGDRHQLLRAATALLAEGVPGDGAGAGATPRLDAELLLAQALGVERLSMLAGRAPVAAAARRAFAALLARRRRHEPVAYITGVREFWSLALRVTPDVLIPRPESETLIEAALAHFADGQGAPDGQGGPRAVLDLGTGSGALLLAALSEWPGAQGIGIDRSAAALAVARANAARLGLAARAEFHVADWADWLAASDRRFDLVLSNPPYVEDGARLSADLGFEPAQALYGGADGLDCYRLLLPRVAGLLRPGGVALFEFGAGQERALLALAAAQGLRATTRVDLGGRPRALVLQRAAGCTATGI